MSDDTNLRGLLLSPADEAVVAAAVERLREETHQTDEEIVDDVLEHLRQVMLALSRHSMKADYHKQVIGMAVGSLRDGARHVQHLKDPIPPRRRDPIEQGPGVGFPSGPRRFRVTIKVTRPFTGVMGGTTEEAIKKFEKNSFRDSGNDADRDAKVYCYSIGNGIDSVKVLDRLTRMLYTYDADGNVAELFVGNDEEAKP